MNYLLLVCSDGVPTEAKAAANRGGLPAWLEMLDRRGARAFGERLANPSAAKTVQVRDGETIVTDGPFADTKEFIAGFDIIGCENLDEAIAIAAQHPVAQSHCIEVRPFAQPPDAPAFCASDAHTAVGDLAARLGRPVPEGAQRFLIMPCVDGIAGSDDEEARIMRDGERWVSELDERGIEVYGHALAPAEAATTVRVRNGETLLSDGPFAETKEFVGGFDVIDCAGIEEAVQIAADHPLARFHRCEVRPFWRDA
jgi:hypothetical protein